MVTKRVITVRHELDINNFEVKYMGPANLKALYEREPTQTMGNRLLSFYNMLKWDIHKTAEYKLYIAISAA